MADRKESAILDVDVDVDDAVESINSLTEANKRLRKERNELNLQSEAGKKRAQEINHLIDFFLKSQGTSTGIFQGHQFFNDGVHLFIGERTQVPQSVGKLFDTFPLPAG